MQITVKARFNSSSERFEKYGQNRYLFYLPFEQDGDAQEVLISLLSRYMGVPPARIAFRGFDQNKDWVFEVN